MIAPSKNSTPTIVYGNDPLCGWCFAIGPALLKARLALADEVTFRIECGGLVTGERVRPIALDRDYLVAGFRQVKATSGREPGPNYWSRVVEPGTWVSNSEPACRAVLVAQKIAPGQAIEFSCALTDALYVEGDLPDDSATVRRIAEDVGIDADELFRIWSLPDGAMLTADAFAHARQLGVTSYPSLYLEVGSRLKPILSGFATTDQIVSEIRTMIAVVRDGG
jgi:putative protein-disulfide isomerase